MMGRKTPNADQLIARLLRGDDDLAANELLNEFLRGYPAVRLRVLLDSNAGWAARAGAWIASELGSAVAPLLPDVARHLDHSSRYVRFFLLDAVLNAAGGADGAVIAKAVICLQDDDEAVRWKALRFLSRGTGEQLQAALPYVEVPVMSEHLRWLLAVEKTRDVDAVLEHLHSRDSDTRRFAAAAATRLYSKIRSPLEMAARSEDPEIRKFAEEELGLQTPED